MNFRLNAKTAGLALFLLFAAKNALPVDGYFTGDGLEGKRILVYSSSVENGNDSDAWLAQKTKRDIINDLVNYSNMDIIDADEKKTIRKLQKDSISGLYSDSDPIELGKMIQAKSYIKLVTSCKRKTYSLSATITNIETGKTEGSGSTPFYSEDDFISKAHGEIAAGILETLGVKLTIAGKRLLQYGTFSQTESESRENIAAYKAELARLEKEQQALRQARKVQVDSEALNARIEAQKALLLQKQKNEEARLIRLREDAKRKMEEQRLSEERNGETQKKILTLSNEIEKKAQKIRAQKVEGLDVFKKIELIEGEKQILASNEKSIKDSLIDFNSQQDELAEKEILERKKQKARITETNADGSLNDVGKKNLESDIEAIKIKHEKIKSENENQVENTAGKLQENLRQKIILDIKSLEGAKYVANSMFNDGVYFRINNYNGSESKHGWEYNLSFVFGGQAICSDEGLLLYNELTGLEVPSYPDAKDPKRAEKLEAYAKYQDNVETYDSFFRLNVPYIQTIVEYSIKIGDAKSPSEYIVTVHKMLLKSTQSEKIIKTIDKDTEGTYKYSPATLVDWNLKNIRKQRELKEEKNNLRQAAEEKKKAILDEQMEKAPWAYQKLGNGGLGGVGFNYKYFMGSNLTAYIELPLTSWLFLDGVIDWQSSFHKNGFSAGGGFGLNARAHLGNFHPAAYYIFDVARLKNYGNLSELALIHNVGLAIPLGSFYNIDVRYSLYVAEQNLEHAFSAGIRMTLPTWTILKKR